MISNIDLGKRLKHFRKKGNITQEEMAKYCQVSKNHISTLERGIYTCNAFILITYAQKLNISLDELVGPLKSHDDFTTNTLTEHPSICEAPEQAELNILPELQNALCDMSKSQQQQILDIIHILKRPVDTAEN